MREVSKLELQAIAKAKKYRQPKCPRCHKEMTLTWGASVIEEGKYEAQYFCPGHWMTWPMRNVNAAIAVEEAYKLAIGG